MSTNQEQKLNFILKGQVSESEKFKKAKKLLKYLKKDVEGLPQIDCSNKHDPRNLYSFIIRRHTEGNITCRSKLHQIRVRNPTNHSFHYVDEQDASRTQNVKKLRFGSGHNRKSIKKMEVKVQNNEEKAQNLRRRSCDCTACGQENPKIQRLKYKGENNNQKMAYSRFVKQRKTFQEDCMNFSLRIQSKSNTLLNNILSNKSQRKIQTFKQLPDTYHEKRRCHSHENYKGNQISIFLHKKSPFKQDRKSRQSLLLFKRQQTINDKLMLIPINGGVESQTQKSTEKFIKIKCPQSINLNKQSSKKNVSKEFLPISPKNSRFLPSVSPNSKFGTKSLNKQLELQVKHSQQLLKKSFLSKTNQSQKLSNSSPYQSSNLGFFLNQIRRRKY